VRVTCNVFANWNKLECTSSKWRYSIDSESSLISDLSACVSHLFHYLFCWRDCRWPWTVLLITCRCATRRKARETPVSLYVPIGVKLADILWDAEEESRRFGWGEGGVWRRGYPSHWVGIWEVIRPLRGKKWTFRLKWWCVLVLKIVKHDKIWGTICLPHSKFWETLWSVNAKTRNCILEMLECKIS